MFYKEGIPAATSVGGVTLSMMGSEASADVMVGETVPPGGNPKYLHQDSAYFVCCSLPAHEDPRTRDSRRVRDAFGSLLRIRAPWLP